MMKAMYNRGGGGGGGFCTFLCLFEIFSAQRFAVFVFYSVILLTVEMHTKETL